MTSGTLTPNDLRRRLATNVRRLRAEASLTIKQCAAKSALHWRHWQKIEAGENNATLFTIVRVAEALNTTPAELLRPAPEPTPPPAAEAPASDK